MVRPDFQKWGQSEEEVRRLAVEAEHRRSRERYQAMYMIGSGQANASQWAKKIKRRKQTVLDWVHQYNEYGPASLLYQASGGRRPKLGEVEKKDGRVDQDRDAPRSSITGLWLDAEKVAPLGGGEARPVG